MAEDQNRTPSDDAQQPEPAEPAEPATPAEPAPADAADIVEPEAGSASGQPADAPAAPVAGFADVPAVPSAPVPQQQFGSPQSAPGYAQQPMGDAAQQSTQAYPQPAASGSQPTTPGQTAAPGYAPQPVPGYPQAPGYQQPPAPGSQPTPGYQQPQDPGYQSAQGYQQPPAPGYPQPSGFYSPAQPSGKATGALVCGIAAIVLSGFPIFGIVLGIVAIVLAGKAVKESGKSGKSTGAKVCGIIGIVFALIWFVVALMMGCSDIASTYDSASSSSASSSSSVPGATAEGPGMVNEATSELESLASAQLDKLKNKDPEFVQQLAAELDERFESFTDYSLSDLGVDPVSFAEWMLADFDYELDGAYDFDDGTGTVYADVTQRDTYAFENAFMDEAQAAIDSGEISRSDEAAVMARLGEICKSVMEKSTGTTDSYVALDMVKSGDAWTIDSDSWEQELEYLFGL